MKPNFSKPDQHSPVRRLAVQTGLSALSRIQSIEPHPVIWGGQVKKTKTNQLPGPVRLSHVK